MVLELALVETNLTILKDLVTEIRVIREVKVRGGTMREGCSTSADDENHQIQNSHILSKLKKERKNKMNLKTKSNHKEPTRGEIKKHK